MKNSLAPSLASVLRPAGASRWMLPSVAAITPQYIEATLRGALAGNHVQAWELFDLMIDTDPEIASCVGEYVDSIACLKPTVNGGDKDKHILISAAMAQMRPDITNDENAIRGTVKDLLFARFHGQTVLEIDWYKKDGKELNTATILGKQVTLPRSTFWVHPVCYAWDMNGRLGLRMALDSQLKQAAVTNSKRKKAITKNLSSDLVRSMVEPPAWNWINSQARPKRLLKFPANKFLIGIDKFKSGTVLGSGSILRTLAWWWIASMFGGDWLLNYAQLFGIPFRKATVLPSTSEAKRDEIRRMLDGMKSAGYCLLDQWNTVELERLAQVTGDTPHSFLLKHADDMKRKLILHPKAIQNGVQYIEEVLNQQFVPYVLNVNYGKDGDVDAPTVTLVDK